MEKVVYWKDMELVVRDFETSHVNGGRLGKLWVVDRKSNRVFMVKGCSFGNYEPFSEKLAYLIGKSIGIDVLEYDIIPAKLFKGLVKSYNPFCRYLSICEKIDRQNYNITSVAEIKRAINATRDGEEDETEAVKNIDVMYDILPRKYIDTMFLFDAIIGNVDRHYGNVHILRNIDGEFVGAPILDNGASLLANKNILELFLFHRKLGDKFNKSFTTKINHDAQMEEVESFTNVSFNVANKTMDILKELEPTLELMPKLRAVYIRKYVIYRLNKYLGMIKHMDMKEYMKRQKGKIKELPEQEWSNVAVYFNKGMSPRY